MPHSYNLDEENNILEVSKRDEFWKFTSHEKFYLQSLEEKEIEDKEKELLFLQNENKNSKQNYTNYFKEIWAKHFYILLSIILFSLILIKWFNPSSANLKTINPNYKFDILKTQNITNLDLISKELQNQKELRNQKNDLELQIQKSINIVKTIEQENKQNYNNLINLSK